jgi:hypothetical protein
MSSHPLLSTIRTAARPALRLFTLAALLAATPALHASTITYQMTFTSGGHTGTGTLTLASPPASSGVISDTIANQQLQQLTFTVANQTFDFSSDPSASVQFVNGQISKINFGRAAGQAPANYTLLLSNGFSLYGSDLSNPLVSGSFDVTPDIAPNDTPSTEPSAASPTPEPGTILLLATALLIGGFFVLRRNRQTQA